MTKLRTVRELSARYAGMNTKTAPRAGKRRVCLRPGTVRQAEICERCEEVVSLL